MPVTQEQIEQYVAVLIAADITPSAFGEFMIRSKLFIDLRALETGLDILARQRSEALAQFDQQEAGLRAQIESKRQEIEALAA